MIKMRVPTILALSVTLVLLTSAAAAAKSSGHEKVRVTELHTASEGLRLQLGKAATIGAHDGKHAHININLRLHARCLCLQDETLGEKIAHKLGFGESSAEHESGKFVILDRSSPPRHRCMQQRRSIHHICRSSCC